jgi:hypothetical protein
MMFCCLVVGRILKLPKVLRYARELWPRRAAAGRWDQKKNIPNGEIGGGTGTVVEPSVFDISIA